MKKSSIEASLRKFVEDRANNACEYCLIPAHQSYYSLQIDHIIPEKHSGPTVEENLALACKPCNCHKGYSVVQYYYNSGKSVLLFNPRKQRWQDHFELIEDGRIQGKTDCGVATSEVLKFNVPERVEFRRMMVLNGSLK